MYSPRNHIFFNLANLYIFRTRGLFLYFNVFNIESINVNLEGQLPCKATDKTPLCKGEGCKNSTHPQIFPPRRDTAALTPPAAPCTQSRSHPQPHNHTPPSQSTHFSLPARALHTPIFFCSGSTAPQPNSYS